MKHDAGPGDGAELRLQLVADQGRITAVRFGNGRPLDLLRGLQDQPAERVPGLLRRLFPICGWAHAIACRRAVLAACGIESGRERTCDNRLRAELALATAWRHTVEWPGLLGRPLDTAPLRAVMLAASRVRDGGEEGPESALRLRELADTLSLAVFGAEAPAGARPEDLLGWLRSTPGTAAALLTAIARSPLAGSPVPAATLSRIGLDGQDWPAWFESRLRARSDFGQRPDVDGQPADIGAWATSDAARREAFGRHGPVAARLLAMLAAAFDRIAGLRAAADGCEAAGRAIAASAAPGTGCGVADTVRGPLAYWVRLEDERIAELRSVAPTEWIVHPRGALARLLRGLPADEVRRLARWTVAAFDPCATLVVDVLETARA